MSASVGGGHGGGSQDFELNLASIIDCFTVLITFMLASAAFLSIGVMDAGVAAAGAQAAGEPPAVTISVELEKDHRMQVKLTGKATRTIAVAAKGAEWDHEGLNRELAAVKQQFPTVAAVTINAESMVEYRDVVKTMETARKSHPAVMLGGF